MSNVLTVNGLFKILSVQDQGVDKNGKKWAQFNVVSRDDQDFFFLHSFGSDAEYLLRNHENGRRVMICGRLEVSKYTEVITIEKEVEVDCAQHLGINLGTLNDKLKVKVKIKEEVEVSNQRNNLYPFHVEYLDVKKDAEKEEKKETEVTVSAPAGNGDLTAILTQALAGLGNIVPEVNKPEATDEVVIMAQVDNKPSNIKTKKIGANVKGR